jgi:hypothetical protein
MLTFGREGGGGGKGRPGNPVPEWWLREFVFWFCFPNCC